MSEAQSRADGVQRGAEPDPAGGAEPDAARGAIDPDGELRALAGDCVHCGFCLPACPTYQLWGEEMDSPRGRIHLINQVLESGQGGQATATHLDRCLGCMACVPACPSGVRYDLLIEAARDWAEAEPGDAARVLPPRSRREQALRSAIFATFPYPRRLRLLLGPLWAAKRTGLDRLAQRSSLLGRLAPEAVAALAVAPRRSPGGHAALPGRVPARGERRAVVGMLTGCVQQVFFPRVNDATAAVLAAEGCDVVIPRGQGCCGALSLHSGRRTEAIGFARRAIDTFEQAGVDAVIVNAAGCGSAMKEYAHLLADDQDWAGRAAALSAKVRDFSEFLDDLGPVAPRSEMNLTVVYHDACHLGHAQRITAQPRSLLRGVPGIRLAEIGDGATCCGSAGIYNLVQPEAAAELGARKARAVQAAAADLLVTANPGCALQISTAMSAGGGPDLPVAHIAEVLDAAIQGRAAESLL
jgi:glycolate dehydrogenase iron-sulfur subunit